VASIYTRLPTALDFRDIVWIKRRSFLCHGTIAFLQALILDGYKRLAVLERIDPFSSTASCSLSDTSMISRIEMNSAVRQSLPILSLIVADSCLSKSG